MECFDFDETKLFDGIERELGRCAFERMSAPYLHGGAIPHLPRIVYEKPLHPHFSICAAAEDLPGAHGSKGSNHTKTVHAASLVEAGSSRRRGAGNAALKGPLAKIPITPRALAGDKATQGRPSGAV
jgi:hypothetical protein